MGAVGSAQAKDGRVSTSRRVHTQLRKVGLRHGVGAPCRRSSPAALQLADVETSQPAAAEPSDELVLATARQLVDVCRHLQASSARGWAPCSVHPPRDGRPSTALGIEVCGTSVRCCAPIVTNQGSGLTNIAMAQPAECMASLPDAQKLPGAKSLKITYLRWYSVSFDFVRASILFTATWTATWSL